MSSLARSKSPIAPIAGVIEQLQAQARAPGRPGLQGERMRAGLDHNLADANIVLAGRTGRRQTEGPGRQATIRERVSAAIPLLPTTVSSASGRSIAFAGCGSDRHPRTFSAASWRRLLGR